MWTDSYLAQQYDSDFPLAQASDWAVGRPTPSAIALLMALFILPKALVPATKQSWFEIADGFYILWMDAWLLLFIAVVILGRLTGVINRSVQRITLYYFFMPFLLLGLWTAVSVSWNDETGVKNVYSLTQVLQMWGAVCVAVFLCSGLSSSGRRTVGSGLVIVILFIVLVYMGLSFVFPSWRPSSSYMNRWDAGLGFIRVFGPLGQATTLNFILFPCLGYSLGSAVGERGKRLRWVTATLLFALAIFGTGSRGALLCAATFGVLLLLALRLRAGWVLFPAAFIAVMLALLFDLPDRFHQMEDSARFTTYGTAYRAWTDSVANFLFGTGHGSIYANLHIDTMRRVLRQDRWFMLMGNTEYGRTLNLSHSVLFRTIAETGLIGLAILSVPFVYMFHWLFRRPSANTEPHTAGLRIALIGCLATVPYMVFEAFVMNVVWLVLIWMCFAILAVEELKDKISK